MLKRVTVLMVICMAAVTTSVLASDDYSISFGIKGGWMVFTGEPFDDAVENNWIVGADAIVWFPAGLGVGLEGKYTSKDILDEELDAFDMDFDFTAAPVSLNLYYKIPGAASLNPYIGAGVTAVYTDLTATYYGFITPLTVSIDDWAVGVNVIAGLDYDMFFLEAQYIWANVTLTELSFLMLADPDYNVGGFNFVAGVRF